MRRLAAVALALAAILLAAGCGHERSAPAARARVDVLVPYRGAEADLFAAGLIDWGRRRGIDVRITGTGNFPDDLRYQVANADPPDIALVPQLGLVDQLVADGDVRPLAPRVAAAAEAALEPRALALGRIDGRLYAIPYKINIKSLVWYRPEVFRELGLRPPTTLGGLEAMAARIAARGITPWCIGIESQSATGWPATDWVEDLVLRRQGLRVYNDWIAGRVRFSDPRIARAFAEFRALALRHGRVAGGLAGAVSADVQLAHRPLFTDPPGCVLYHQASFALAWMPPGLTVGPQGDIDVFPMPPDRAADPAPLVVGADMAVALSDRPGVDAVMTRLTSPAAGAAWARAGGFVSPIQALDVASYYPPSDVRLVEALLGAGTLAFDASDAMPPEVGTTLLWGLITRWVADNVSYRTLARLVDLAYPR